MHIRRNLCCFLLLLASVLLAEQLPQPITAAKADTYAKSITIGSLLKVNGLIKSGVEINELDDIGNTALCIAARLGNFPIVKMLIDNGAEIDLRDKTGSTPLHWACRTGHYKIAKYLVGNGADRLAKDINLTTPLMVACRYGDVDIIKLILEKNQNINALSKKGLIGALHNACIHGQLDAVKLLLDRGARIELPLSNFYRPLHHAISSGNLDLVKFLLRKGAQMDVLTDKKQSVLHLAAYHGHAHIIDFLIRKKKVDIDPLDIDGRSPLLYSALRGYNHASNILLFHGADKTIKDRLGIGIKLKVKEK